METDADDKKYASIHRRNAALFYISGDAHPARLQQHRTLMIRPWSFLCSLTLHVFLFMLISSPAFNHPLPISTHDPVILWFTPVLSPDNGAEVGLPIHGQSVAFAASQELPRQSSYAVDQPAQSGQGTVATDILVSAAIEVTPATPVPEKKIAKSVHIPPSRVAIPVPESSPVTPLLPAEIPAKKLPAEGDAKTVSYRDIALKPPDAEAIRPTQTAAQEIVLQKKEDEQVDHAAVQQAADALRHSREASERLQTERNRAAVELAKVKQLAHEKNLQERKKREEALRTKTVERINTIQAEQKLSSVPERTMKAASALPMKPPVPQLLVKPPEKAMVAGLPLVKGDLKLVISGSEKMPLITITSVEFPLTRRDRPFTRAESRRSQPVSPLIARTRDATREVIVVHTKPAVYAFVVEPENGPTNVNIVLKVFEGTSRSITRSLGSHATSGRKVLFKILMPEGILWDDATAFSGSMEDSESITKYSSETGLMWKEYSE